MKVKIICTQGMVNIDGIYARQGLQELLHELRTGTSPIVEWTHDEGTTYFMRAHIVRIDVVD